MNYLQEWNQSCVDEQLTRLNVICLEGDRPLEYLLYSDELPRRNDGRINPLYLKRYAHTELGGWWCSGIDLLTGDEDLWGCFKPIQPRHSIDRGKAIKYEHPPKAPAGIFALRVPLHIWEKIAQRYEVEILPSDIDRSQPDLGFWQWLIDRDSVPLCITEGAKKAGALLTAGYAAIALPGINGGYRVPRDESGNRVGKSCLIPQLAKLASEKREIYFVFDRDTKPSTVKAVEAAIRKTGSLLAQAGCTVKVVTWNLELGKGVDDLIANAGEKAFDRAYARAIPLEIWKAQSWHRLTYTSNFEVNSRYLQEDIDIPKTAKLIGIKSPKGTGKTRFLAKIVKKALDRRQKVLVIGHRIRLVEELCQRFGLNYITEISKNNNAEVLGYGLCIDSLHPNSQAQFHADDWKDALVIIDEVEQVLWHGLNSITCKDNRVAILKSLKTLMQSVLGGEGRVCIADADLSDLSIDYLISLAGIYLEPLIIKNEWKPTAAEAWRVYKYDDPAPNRLVKDLEKHIQEGEKPFVCLSAQKIKSQWGTCTLEAYLTKQFPKIKILRIDSESLAEPTHPAYGCINNLTEVLANYDLVLASPSIETGVSIDLRGHFTSVWCIAQGVQEANAVRQALGRIRENVPRYVWIAPYGFNQVGNGSTSIPALLTSGHRLTQLNVQLLQQSDFAGIDDLDTGFQAESLLCWAKMAVRLNASMLQYRESVLAALQGEGHYIIDAILSLTTKKDEKKEPELENPLMVEIMAVQEQNYQAECEAIALAEDLNSDRYQVLKKKLVKSTTIRRSLRKYELKQRYSIPVTPTLVKKDDEGWYEKIRLHYYLTVGRSYLAQRDRSLARKLIQQGEGSIFLPDFNHSQLGAIIGTIELFGIPLLLENPGRELSNTDEDLQLMAAIALNNRSAIQTVIGIKLAKNSTPIMIVRRFLEQIGYSLKLVRCGIEAKKRIRVYQMVNPEDGRFEIFRQWKERNR